MSTLKISIALEKRLLELTPEIASIPENTAYTPIEGVPYQQVYFLFAAPENPSMDTDFHRQRGYMQVTLRYPPNKGSGDAQSRGELIKNWFRRGLSFEHDGVTTQIEFTPEVGAGKNIDDRFVVIVKVRFFANIIE